VTHRRQPPRGDMDQQKGREDQSAQQAVSWHQGRVGGTGVRSIAAAPEPSLAPREPPSIAHRAAPLAGPGRRAVSCTP
jgi:hypothetical protein